MEERFRTIRIHPDGAQIVCSEQPCLLLIVVLTILTGWDGLLPEAMTFPLLAVIGCLLLYLLFRYMYLTRMVFVIGGEQLMHEHDILGVAEKDNLIQELRHRVEVNKTRRNIHEFTNMQ